jgi:recombination protein RecA
MPMTKKEKSMADRSSTAVSAASSEREKAIDLALQQIERRFGKGAIMKLGDASHIQVEVIPTG